MPAQAVHQVGYGGEVPRGRAEAENFVTDAQVERAGRQAGASDDHGQFVVVVAGEVDDGRGR